MRDPSHRDAKARGVVGDQAAGRDWITLAAQPVFIEHRAQALCGRNGRVQHGDGVRHESAEFCSMVRRSNG